ncbi:MAG: pyruvoyl-dependent arginine decarboxylase [Bacteroidales bacterium]|nr:pyruvoyl-dependent arginine decarboxylase [Bacteroidales bacterium]
MITQTSTLNLVREQQGLNGILVGNRIPRDYFVTKGTGESDITVHAGSYHLALKSAGIEMCNIMTYSSILPGIARKVERPQHLEHGAVMESIMSVCTASKGEQATAGIIYGWLHDRKTNEKFGGLVCEHYGNYGLNELNARLEASLDELYLNGFAEKFTLSGIEKITESFVPEKAFGTALVALCFVNYVYPVIGMNA